VGLAERAAHPDGRAADALTLWFALTWVVAMACVQAIVRSRGVFLRTPKSASGVALLRAFQTTSWETTLGTAAIIGGIWAAALKPSPASVALMLLAASQAMIYLSAPFHSLLSAHAAGKRARAPHPAEARGAYVTESRIGVAFGVASFVMLAVALAASLWPQPTRLPNYAVLQPQPALPRIIEPTPMQAPTLGPTPIPPTPLPPTLTAGAVDSNSCAADPDGGRADRHADRPVPVADANGAAPDRDTHSAYQRLRRRCCQR